MATLTIRQLDESVKEKLRVRAARAGRSMEEEAREILGDAVGAKAASGAALLDLSRQLFSGRKGVELQLPKRGLHDRPPPEFTSKPRRRK